MIPLLTIAVLTGLTAYGLADGLVRFVQAWGRFG